MSISTLLHSGFLKRTLWFCLLLIPIVFYACTIRWLHWNLPIHDDYIVQLEIAQILKAKSVGNCLHILFSQLNEHRLFYTRVCFLINYLICKNLSYSFLIFLGNLPLLGIWSIITYWQRKTRISPWLVVIVSWILFQFQYYENSLWAMAALQNITIHFFYMLLFTSLARPSGRVWFGSMVVGILICFTSGNGLLAFMIGASTLVLQRRWRHLLIWGVIFTAIIFLYFSDYRPIKSSHAGIVAPELLIDKFLGLLTFLGHGLVVHQKLSATTTVMALGFALAAISTYLSSVALRQLLVIFAEKTELSFRYRLMTLLVQVNTFIILSAAILAYNRMSKGHYESMISSRYQLYPTMLILANVCLFYILYVNKWKIITLLLLIATIVCWPLIFQKNISEMYQFRNQALAFYYNTAQIAQADTVWKDRIFKPDTKTNAELRKIDKALNSTPTHLARRSIEISGNDLLTCDRCANRADPDEWTFFVLQNEKYHLLFPALRNFNQGFRSFWLKGKIFDSGSSAKINLFFLKASESTRSYRIGFLERRNEGVKLFSTNVKFEHW